MGSVCDVVDPDSRNTSYCGNIAIVDGRAFLGIGIFDPALGGDPVLFQHFFWFYSHPVVYVMILPAFGVISETITIHSRKHIFGYTAIAGSSVAIAAVGFVVWGHHMFLSGQSEDNGCHLLIHYIWCGCTNGY